MIHNYAEGYSINDPKTRPKAVGGKVTIEIKDGRQWYYNISLR